MLAAVKKHAALNVAAIKAIAVWFGLFVDALKKYAVFAGRASRLEYFAFVVVAVVIDLILVEVADTLALDIFIIADIFVLVMFVPAISITFRRLHDFGSSGWSAVFVYAPAPFMFAVYAFIYYHPQAPDNIFSEEMFAFLGKHDWLVYAVENALLFYSIMCFLVFHFLISICIFIRLFLIDSDKGDNKYGAPPNIGDD